ncbi:MAG: hypothetical protein HPY57_12715 [Ignavibacteria bacterium]|nr:hypothetical protein [Ignavibacteria bacterium]
MHINNPNYENKNTDVTIKSILLFKNGDEELELINVLHIEKKMKLENVNNFQEKLQKFYTKKFKIPVLVLLIYI